MDKLYYFLYQFLLVPLLSVLVFLLAPFIPKLKEGLAARNWGLGRSYPEVPKNRALYWFHCSSGEIEYAKAVIRQLKNRYPQCFVLVTWHSPSAVALIKGVKEVDLAIPSPWESQSSYRKFLSHFKPKALLVSRTDIWPSMLAGAKRYQIPRILFAATFVKSSSRYKNRFIRSFYQWAHSYFTDIYCVSEDDKKNFCEVDLPAKVQVSGDPRFDQVLWRIHTDFKPRSPIPPSQKKTFIMGSTWEEDEERLLPAMSKNKNSYRYILVPHEPTKKHIESLSLALKKQGLNFQLYSEQRSFEADTLIVDQVGVLAHLYLFADVSFIGGSFKGSVHSVMEGLGAGTPVLLGPHYKNNREAILFKDIAISKYTTAVSICETSEDLSVKLENFAKTQDFTKLKNNLETYFTKQTGTAQKLVDSIL